MAVLLFRLLCVMAHPEETHRVYVFVCVYVRVFVCVCVFNCVLFRNLKTEAA